jgi:hypothetical protein
MNDFIAAGIPAVQESLWIPAVQESLWILLARALLRDHN